MNAKKNKLGLFSLTALVTGTMVGSGIFIFPADLARIGSISLLAWAATSCGAFTLALVFAKMSSIVPKSGGPYAYTQAGFGNFIGFQTAYNYWLALWVGSAGLAVASLGYLRVFLPFLAYPYIGTFFAIVIIWIFTAINLRGVRFVGVTQIITAILKFIPLIIVAFLGWGYFHPEYLTHSFNISHQSNMSAFSHVAALTIWTFIGVETATVPADSVVNPRRTIPIATLLGTAIAAIIYITTSTAIMGMLPPEVLANSTSPFAAAIAMIFGKWGELITAAGATIACFGALNGWILLQGQIPMAAAKDELFPRIFAKRNVNDVPANGLVISSILASVLLLFTTSPSLLDQFRLLILLASVSSLLIYFYTAVAAFIIFHKRTNALLINKGNIIIAIIAACYSFWALLGAGKDAIFYVTVFGFTGIPLYAWIQYKKSNFQYDTDVYQNDM